MRTSVAAFGAAVVAAGLIGAGLTGCSSKDETRDAKPVSAADLQTKLTEQLTEAGNPPESVTCKGRTARRGGQVHHVRRGLQRYQQRRGHCHHRGGRRFGPSFDLSPSLTKDAGEGGLGLTNATAASCDSGLAGAIGETTTCEVTVDGVVSKRVAAIDGSTGCRWTSRWSRWCPRSSCRRSSCSGSTPTAHRPRPSSACPTPWPSPAPRSNAWPSPATKKVGYDVSVTTIGGQRRYRLHGLGHPVARA